MAGLPATRPVTAARLRVLVTGSRGKSSVVRLVHAAFAAAGHEAWARRPADTSPRCGGG